MFLATHMQLCGNARLTGKIKAESGVEDMKYSL